MSVLIETTVGNLVIDLFCDQAPLACKNFLKLCKIKYYNAQLFFEVQNNFLVKCGDPTAIGNGGTSIYGILKGDQNKYFKTETSKNLKHKSVGTIGMVDPNGSQFYITSGGEVDHLDGKQTVFGELAEGEDILNIINEAFCDEAKRPYVDIRICHTYVLDDPFEDPEGLLVPDASPLRETPEDEMVEPRLTSLEDALEDDGLTEREREERDRRQKAKAAAMVLEMVGDLPDMDVKPPDNVLFVCKLNPHTEDADLELIFSRFGTITQCEIIRDYKTGDSLNYAFIEFDEKVCCEEAYFKMNNVLIDDRRIKVDFSQSVSQLWNKHKRNEKMTKSDADVNRRGNGSSRGYSTGSSNPGASSSSHTKKGNSKYAINVKQQNRTSERSGGTSSVRNSARDPLPQKNKKLHEESRRHRDRSPDKREHMKRRHRSRSNDRDDDYRRRERAGRSTTRDKHTSSRRSRSRSRDRRRR